MLLIIVLYSYLFIMAKTTIQYIKKNVYILSINIHNVTGRRFQEKLSPQYHPIHKVGVLGK